MAAAYTTGISSSPTNLLTTFVSWLVTQGWTVDSSASEGSGWRSHLHKGSVYLNFRAAMDEEIWVRDEGPPILYHDYGDGGYGIGLYLGTGYDGGNEWYEQAGGPVSPDDGSTMGCGVNLPSGSVAAYHFFDDGADNVIAVIERSPGIFGYIGFGPDLSDAGQPEAFWYFFGSAAAVMNTHDGGVPDDDGYGISVSALPPTSVGNEQVSSITGSTARVQANAYVRVDVATYSGRWVHNSEVDTAGYGSSGRTMRSSLNLNPNAGGMDANEFPNYARMEERAYQSAYAGALFIPLHMFVLTDPGARWAPLGFAPSIYWTEAVGHGYAAGDVYAVGGVNYMLFPHFAVYKGA